MSRPGEQYPSQDPTLPTLPMESELPTGVLGLARDDQHRTELLAQLAQNDERFQGYRRQPRLEEVAPGEFEDVLVADINTHYSDLDEARGGLHIVRYVELAQQRQRARGVAAVMLGFEMLVSRTLELSVRQAIRNGTIPKQ